MSIAFVIGFVAAVGAICIATLIDRARRAGNQRRESPRGRAPRATSMSGLLPSLLHPHLLDATASEFDDVRRPRFTPVILLTEPKEPARHAPAKGC